MSGLIWILALLVALLKPEWLQGATTTQESGTVRENTFEARVVGYLPQKARQQLKRALLLAVQGLGERPDCGELFAALGADGREKLQATIYSGPISSAESELCRRRHAAALTTVRGRRTIICSPTFGELRLGRAAVVLLHEALHHAGLTESPADPGAQSAREIDRMVAVACGF